jgi:hypothetical protein
MRPIDMTRFAIAAALAALVASPVLSQSMGDASMHTLQQPYDVETFGVFRSMMMSGDFTAKVSLDAAMAKQPTAGVGALSDARGEITIYDGKLIVNYGKATPTIYPSESAALLASARVQGWQSIRVENDVPPGEIESFISVTAKTHGIDPEVSFPFEVRGGIGPYVMHVNAAPTNGAHGMALPMAITVQSQGDRLDGLVAGLYVSLDLMGIATHGGERTHSHWVSLDMARTAHLDRWGIKAGAFLLLPKSR